MTWGTSEAGEISRMGKNSAGLSILVVDDEQLIRWSLAETLSADGHDVVEAGSAAATRRAIADATRAFDVVLLDFRLPDSEDLSLLASVRRTSPTSRVILMTAFGTPEVVRGALELGAYRVVNKPFEMREIADLVADAE